jgi:hypothetical protein
MKKYIFSIIFFLLFFAVKSQNPFSDSTVVSLLTCSPGPAVYAKFGHTGLRFYDPLTKNDVVFNYGLFNFDDDNFILKFIKGNTYYNLGAENTVSFLYQYEARNSSVTEQILNLTVDERKQLIDLVLENYEPENRTYLYNFVFDNCATRPFYKILESIDGNVVIDMFATQKTFREWVREYAGTGSWTMFGIDLLFGRDADKLCTPEQSLFLPEILMEQLNSTKIITQEGEKEFVSDTSVLVNIREKTESSHFYLSPFFASILIWAVFSLLAILCVKAKNRLRWILFPILFISGIFGVILAYLMFVSIHPLVHQNWNILWLNPLNLVAAFLLFFKKLKKIMSIYILINVLMLVLLVIIAIFNVQYFNPAEHILWILFGFVYFCWLKTNPKNKKINK